jgi:anaerobic selenocysteine-containing dehydrogenase
MTVETRYSYCRNCAANCGMVFEVENNQILSARSDRDNIVSSGYVCIKGSMAVELHRGEEDRLTHCLKRGEDGQYHPIDKYQAVDEIAERLRGILDRYGPRALGAFFGTTSYSDCIGKPFLKSLMAAIGSPATFSSMTVDQSSKWVTVSRMGYWATGRPLYTQTDMILFAGVNPLVSHSGYPNTPIPGINIHEHFRAAKKQGIKIIVIDPRHSEVATYADLFIQPNLRGADPAGVASGRQGPRLRRTLYGQSRPAARSRGAVHTRTGRGSGGHSDVATHRSGGPAL